MHTKYATGIVAAVVAAGVVGLAVLVLALGNRAGGDQQGAGPKPGPAPAARANEWLDSGPPGVQPAADPGRSAQPGPNGSPQHQRAHQGIPFSKTFDAKAVLAAAAKTRYRGRLLLSWLDDFLDLDSSYSADARALFTRMGDQALPLLVIAAHIDEPAMAENVYQTVSGMAATEKLVASLCAMLHPEESLPARRLAYRVLYQFYDQRYGYYVQREEMTAASAGRFKPDNSDEDAQHQRIGAALRAALDDEDAEIRAIARKASELPEVVQTQAKIARQRGDAIRRQDEANKKQLERMQKSGFFSSGFGPATGIPGKPPGAGATAAGAPPPAPGPVAPGHGRGTAPPNHEGLIALAKSAYAKGDYVAAEQYLRAAAAVAGNDDQGRRQQGDVAFLLVVLYARRNLSQQSVLFSTLAEQQWADGGMSRAERNARKKELREWLPARKKP
jgi:hypothetical protein